MSQNVFISYSRKNLSQALRLAERLRTRGFEIWIDQRGIEGATRWTSEIVKGIEECSVFLLLISADAMASDNVMRELDMALDMKKRIVPVGLDTAPLTRDFMYHLAGIQRVSGDDFEAIHRACLKPIESRIVSTPAAPKREQAHQGWFKKQFHGWTWASWGTAIFIVLAFLEFIFAFMLQGTNGLPNVNWEVGSKALVVTSVLPAGQTQGYRVGDTLETFAGAPTGKGELTDGFYDAMKRHRAGDVVPVVVRRANERITISDTLRNNPMPAENRYSTLLWMAGFLAFAYVLFRQPGSTAVQLYALVSAIGMMFVLPPFNIPLPREGVGFPGILTLMGPPMWLVGAFILHFACCYLPAKQRKWIAPFGYLIAAPATIAAAYNGAGALFTSDIAGFRYLPSYLIDWNVGIALLLFFTLVVFIASYIQTKERATRKRIRLILWAMSCGAFLIIVVTQLPALGILPYLPHSDMIVLIVLLLAMSATAFGLVRSMSFDTDVVINRSAVYAIVLLVILALYTGMDKIGVNGILSVVMVAVLFDPSRRRVQKFVDRKFFKLTYNYREAEREATASLASAGSVLEIGQYVVNLLQTMLPTETAAFFTIDETVGITLVASVTTEPERHRAMGEEVHRRLIEFGPEAWNFSVGLPDMLEAGVKAVASEDNELRALGAAMLTPVRSAEGGLKGFYLTGRKSNGWKFSAEDIDLLQSISVTTSHALARLERNIAAQQHEAERARFERRTKMKAVSGSSLPHEFVVMSDNIQTFRSIESKQLAYGPQLILLDDIVQRAVQSLASDLLMEQFEVDLQLTSNATVQADPKLLEQAVRTLLSHAMKYSSNNRTIEVASMMEGPSAVVRITDRGIGMTDDEQALVFEPFKRGANKAGRSTGAGIGLYIVKHIVEASGGIVDLESSMGKGTKVTIAMPTVSHT